MKKFILTAMFIFGFIAPLAAQAGLTKYVCVKEAALKNGTGFFSSKVAVLHYGDAVKVLGTKHNRSRVALKSDPSVTGWISSGSLTSKKIVGSSKKVSASADEIALAGKGFSAEVEGEYRKKGKYNYTAVDAVEQKSVTDTELYSFVVDGKLEGAE